MASKFEMKATLSLTEKDFSRENLERFLAEIPKESDLTVKTEVIHPTFTGNQIRAIATLVATWKI